MDQYNSGYILGIPTKKFLIGITVLFGLFILYLILTIPLYKGYALHKTPFTSFQFSQVRGDDIYSYNGTSFFKSSLHQPYKTSVVVNIGKLPAIEMMKWGDEGVLLTFTDGGYLGSLLEQKLTSQNQTWDEETQNYLWYLDFKTKKLHLVNRGGIIGNAVYYSAKDKGFYYASVGDNTADTDSLSETPIVIYSTETLQETVVQKSVVSTIEYLGPCANSEQICSIQQSDNHMRLTTIGDSKNKDIIAPAYTSLLPTSAPDRFIGIKSDNSKGSDSEDLLLEGDVYYINITTGKEYRTGDKVNISTTLVANHNTDDSFYVVDPSGEDKHQSVHFLTGAQNIFGAYKTKSATFTNIKLLTEESLSLSPPYSRNTSGVTSFYDANNSMYIITPKSFTYSPPELSQQEVESAWKKCFDQYSKSHVYSAEAKQFKLNMTYDGLFQQKIEDFASCINRTKIDPGYSFTFTGVDPVNGRYVTD